jgi:hypothetical protein
MIERFREGIARSVQQDRVTILGRDVLPFFSDVLSRDTIDANDRDRARAIAESIRRVMVDEADRSWLEALIDEVAAADAGRRVVWDSGRLASMMTQEQRVCLRALLIALSEVVGFDCGSLRIRLLAESGLAQARLSAVLAVSPRAAKRLIAPYLAVMRASFAKVRVESVHPGIGIWFSYELR